MIATASHADVLGYEVDRVGLEETVARCRALIAGADCSHQASLNAAKVVRARSDERLAEIHAHYLALYRSDDPQEKALGLKALDMAYRLKGAYSSLDATAEDFAQAVISAYACRKAALAPARAPVIEAPKGHGGSVQ